MLLTSGAPESALTQQPGVPSFPKALPEGEVFFFSGIKSHWT